MRALMAVAAFAAVAATAGPVLADWAPTRWGMSPAEVGASLGGKAQALPSGSLKVEAPYTVAGFTFDRVIFSFDNGHLTRVLLEGDLSLFERVNAALAAVYGQPVSAEGDAHHRERVYVDREKGNTLHLSEGNTTTILTYTPIPRGF